MAYSSRNLRANHELPISKYLDVGFKKLPEPSFLPNRDDLSQGQKSGAGISIAVLYSMPSFLEDITDKCAMRTRDGLRYSAAMERETVRFNPHMHVTRGAVRI